MLRGTTTFKCEKCGHKFVGPDMELEATVLTAPLTCPECGGTAYAVHESWFRKISNLWN